jgi:hypothetical protein
MSAYEIIKKPITEIREYLIQYGAELRPTKFEQTYLIKFSPETQSSHPAVNLLRGLIFNVWTGLIYSLGYPVPIEFKDQTPEEQEKILTKIKSRSYTVQEALDGTLIRLWYHTETGQWVTSTNGVEDAYSSVWMNGVSYGALFASTLQGVFQNLNPNHVYLFTLCHPLNVIVVNHTAPRIYHVATYDRTTLKEIPCELGIEHSPAFNMTVDEVLTHVRESQGTPVMSAGYMVVQEDEDGIVRRYRFENINYTKGRVLRGESNNIDYILLDHMLASDPNNLKDFLQYYPIYNGAHTQLSSRLSQLCSLLYQEYGQRYKQALTIFVHPRHHKFLGELHTQVYLAQLKPQGKTVQLQDVIKFIHSQPTAKVLYLLNDIYI